MGMAEPERDPDALDWEGSWDLRHVRQLLLGARAVRGPVKYDGHSSTFVDHEGNDTFGYLMLISRECRRKALDAVQTALEP